MSISSSMTVECYHPLEPVLVYQALKEEGWQAQDGVLFYEHYRDAVDLGDLRPVLDKDVVSVLEDLSRRVGVGETVGFRMHWQGDRPIIGFYLDTPTRLTLFFDGTRPTIPGTERLTDFTWVIAHTVEPLMRSGLALKSVRCEDSY